MVKTLVFGVIWKIILVPPSGTILALMTLSSHFDLVIKIQAKGLEIDNILITKVLSCCMLFSGFFFFFGFLKKKRWLG